MHVRTARRPHFAVLDEATSALDVPLEEVVMAGCVRRRIALLSIGHRPSLARHHSTLLLLDGRGGYTVHAIGGGGAVMA
jgi:ABC-type uncharacterized transport system fused permease/ATPase subunit